MDGEPSSALRGCFFRFFVFSSLAILLGIQFYGYMYKAPSEGFEGDFSDIKYVVMQLTRGLTEVNRKHEHLKTEMERLATAIPKVAAATGRAKDALQYTSCRKGSEMDYDRQVTDFALESAGARILDTGDTQAHVFYESAVGYALHMLASLMCRGGPECMHARVMLRPGTLPGECWAFRGSHGHATIRLLGTVRIVGVSLEHIPPHISPTKDISSAPRMFQVEGLMSRNDEHPYDFGTFEYNREGRPIQYFEVQHPTLRTFNIVRLRILSNWGHPVYTCVYRFRVHGDLSPHHMSPPHITDEDTRIDNE